MPLYEYRCPDGTCFDASFPMAEVPDLLSCPACGVAARRRISPPRLSIAGTTAYALIDATKRSAYAPPVVCAPAPSGRSQVFTQNPLHQKLPRP